MPDRHSRTTSRHEPFSDLERIDDSRVAANWRDAILSNLLGKKFRFKTLMQ